MRWGEIEAQVPELAAAVKRLLEAHKHKTLATLRKDGAPRISGTETEFKWGDLWLGSMEGALKVRDLLRDPRYALHSGSDDPPGWKEDAKVAGRAEEVTDAARKAEYHQDPNPWHLFRLDVTEMSWVRTAGDYLIIESWSEPGGYQRRERR